jgi:hypothetical protein
VFDFNVKPRLSDDRGNALLVASSIYEACRYYVLFQGTPLHGKCAVVTSYDPKAKDVTKEEVGANTETDKQFHLPDLPESPEGRGQPAGNDQDRSVRGTGTEAWGPIRGLDGPTDAALEIRPETTEQFAGAP